jgi:23S rRNA (uracil1939-C5)-methyltransferase
MTPAPTQTAPTAAAQVLEVRIDRIVPGGDGMGRHEGRPVFVPLAAPGDELSVRILEDKPDYLRGAIVDIFKPGPGRVEPVCKYYGECGGCTMMHLSYEAQLEAKLGILRDAWRRSGGLPDPSAFGANGLGIVGSQALGYRNRAQFHFDQDREAGYARASSSSILAVESCPILVPPLAAWLENAGRGAAWSRMAPYMPGKDRFLAFGYRDSVYLEGQDSELTVNVLDKSLRFHLGGFFQSNLGMLESLVPAVCEGLSGSRAADLYCGVGLFGVFLRDTFGRLSCVEQDQRAVAYAYSNVGKHADFTAMSVEEWTKSSQARIHFDHVVVDPPRAGLAKDVRLWIANARPASLGYVSCDPVSLARDAGHLVRAGYKVENATIFDFYPQTAHVETYVRFTLD